MMKKKILVPDIGDFENIAVIEVLANVGDSIAAEESLLTLESDKATMDVPSPFTGKITAVHIKAGDKVSAGTHIADMEIRESANDTKSENDAKNESENESRKTSPGGIAAARRSTGFPHRKIARLRRIRRRRKRSTRTRHRRF